MIELYLSKVTENSEIEQAGKLYARVDYKESLGIEDWQPLALPVLFLIPWKGGVALMDWKWVR